MVPMAPAVRSGSPLVLGSRCATSCKADLSGTWEIRAWGTNETMGATRTMHQIPLVETAKNRDRANVYGWLVVVTVCLLGWVVLG